MEYHGTVYVVTEWTEQRARLWMKPRMSSLGICLVAGGGTCWQSLWWRGKVVAFFGFLSADDASKWLQHVIGVTLYHHSVSGVMDVCSHSNWTRKKGVDIYVVDRDWAWKSLHISFRLKHRVSSLAVWTVSVSVTLLSISLSLSPVLVSDLSVCLWPSAWLTLL